MRYNPNRSHYVVQKYSVAMSDIQKKNSKDMARISSRLMATFIFMTVLACRSNASPTGMRLMVLVFGQKLHWRFRLGCNFFM